MFRAHNTLAVINTKIKSWLEPIKGFDSIIKHFLAEVNAYITCNFQIG